MTRTNKDMFQLNKRTLGERHGYANTRTYRQTHLGSKISKPWHTSKVNSVQLSEKQRENRALEREEWKGRLRTTLAEEPEGAGNVSSSTPSASKTTAGLPGSADSEVLGERSCRSW